MNLCYACIRKQVEPVTTKGENTMKKFTEMLNQKTISLKLKRIDVCDLMLACLAVSDAMKQDGQTAEKWDALHDKLEKIINEFDEKQEL